jgi:hypothetical protein
MVKTLIIIRQSAGNLRAYNPSTILRDYTWYIFFYKENTPILYFFYKKFHYQSSRAKKFFFWITDTLSGIVDSKKNKALKGYA